jgi:capsular exopolysaccharide synthesis family protein
MAQLDPQYRPLAERSMWARMSSDLTRANAVPGAAPAYVQTRDRDLQMILGQSEELLKGYREKIRAADRADIQKELRRLEAEVAILADQKQQLEKDVEEKRKEAEQVGRNSIDVQMMLSEVRHLEQVFSSMVDERERLQVELRGASRVRIIGDVERPAEVPQNESNRPMRLALIFFGGLVGFCLPVLGIAVWDVQAGRINGAWEVAQGLGLRVLGSVPMIPARVLRQLAAPTKRNQTWRVRLTESVDGLVARLLRKAEQEQSRVLLVSSAMPGEGKTTLATQLAMSLVRNLRRTVLVDFDLRRPALGGLFGLPAEPGVCEALRGQGDVLDMIHATDSDSPAILTAGRWDRQVLAALGNGAAGALIERLRAHYDFVVIDSSPILPIADTRLVSQQVDTVILSVFRDKSQTARVLAAAEILEAFGVRSIEVVVTGGQELCYGRDSGYQPLAEFEPEVPQPPAAETDAT